MPSIDLSVLRALYAGDWPSAWVHVAVAVTFLGSGWMLVGLLPAIAAPKLRKLALSALVTLALTSAAVSLLKMVTARVRPCNALTWCRALPIDYPSDHSLPSGHAAGSFAFAAFVFGIDRRAGWFALSVASLVALSRVALGVHYPTDVLSGALLGSAMGLTGARLYRSRGTPPSRDAF